MTAGLLESESTGGAVARVGFEYQDAFVLQHLPRWLAHGAFSHVVSEAVGDLEVCYHAAGGGVQRVLHEAKDYVLTSTQFWAEIARFKQVHETSPAEFARFALVCRDFNSVTVPLVSKVARLRGVGASFDDGSVMLANARREIVEWVTGKGQSEATAQFVIDRVEFVTYGAEHADAAFAGEVERHLPTLNLRAREVAALRDQCKVLVAGSSLGPVHRASIEAAVINLLGDEARTWRATATPVLLMNQRVNLEDLGLDVTDFTGPQRSQRSASDWATLSAALTGIGDFIKASRPRPCVALDGKQRMSVACLAGYALSATRGLVLNIEHNGQHYRTNNHDKGSGKFFDQTVESGTDTKQGVVCIGFPTPVGADSVAGAGAELVHLPRLELSSGGAIANMMTLNLAVAEAKQALMRFRSANRLELVHLFIKAPSVFAMALGHRLNGVGGVQLYDWVDGGYALTATPSERQLDLPQPMYQRKMKDIPQTKAITSAMVKTRLVVASRFIGMPSCVEITARPLLQKVRLWLAPIEIGHPRFRGNRSRRSTDTLGLVSGPAIAFIVFVVVLTVWSCWITARAVRRSGSEGTRGSAESGFDTTMGELRDLRAALREAERSGAGPHPRTGGSDPQVRHRRGAPPRPG